MTESTEPPKTSVRTQRSKMHACLCTLAFVSVFVSVSSVSDFIGFGVVNSIVVQPTTQEEQTTPKSDEGLRRKRGISSSDSVNIINTINSLRGSVGASNMNYLTYSNSIGYYGAQNWTSYCDGDADLYYTEKLYVVIYASRSPPDHISVLGEIFEEPTFYNPFRSVYLRYVGAGQSACFYGTQYLGKYYSGLVYLTVYAFSRTSSFNSNLTQFALGKECTTCQSGSYWCDGGLCRDDCSSQISTCSCFPSCTRCQDWSTRTCSCPSQPYTDAVALNCSNPTRPPVQPTPPPKKSGSCKPYITSWAAIIVSTLAILHLQ